MSTLISELPPSAGDFSPVPAGGRPNAESEPKHRDFWETLGTLPNEPASWDRTAWAALIALVAVWAILFRWTWATWGNVTIDSGREMYVPAVLAKGQVLYRDISYAYTPLAPYFNSLLFRLFGVHLEILYWAGSLAALGSAILLFMIGMRLCCRLAGWTAGAVLLVEAFRRGLFSFPLPYSYASVYGCLVACLFLWLIVRTSVSSSSPWRFATASAAAAALLLKLEFGTACYGVLGALIAAECSRARTWKHFTEWLLALVPGVITSVAVAASMISIRGAYFITHENIDSWPSSYFMQQYGKLWLHDSCFDINPRTIETALLSILAASCIMLALRWILAQAKGNERRLIFWMVIASALAILADLSSPTHLLNIFGLRFSLREILTAVGFPTAMAVIVAGASLGAWWAFFRNKSGHASATVALVLTFSVLLPFRNLLATRSYGYSVYNDGPELLSFLMIVSLFVSPITSSKLLRICGTSLVCAMCLGSAIVDSNISDAYFKTYVPMTTERGTIRLPAGLAANYQAAVAFMSQRAAAGETAMSIPEDTSLYFFSGTECPTRLCIFVPGVVAPGEIENEVITQLDQRRPKFLIWSNRRYPEYGAPRFGTDFNVPVGDYLRAHYRPVGSLVKFDPTQWGAVVWERIPDTNSQQ